MFDVGGGIGPVSSQSGDTNFSQARRVLIVSDELNASSTSLGNRGLVLIDDFEEKSQRRRVVQPA